MPEIDADGIHIHYQLDGREDAAWLILSNSLGSDLSMWDRQVATLGERFRVLRYDSRGHGRSAAPAAPYTIERLGRDVLALMDALRIPRAHFCGLSKGGMVGMWLAAGHPDRIAGLVLANTAAHLPPPELWNARIKAVSEKGMEAVADTVIDRWFTATFRQTEPNLVEAARRMFNATSPVGYAAACAAIRDMDLRPALSKIKAATLVIAGDQDAATPPVLAEDIVAAIPTARLTMLPAAHLSNVEAAAAFDEAVLSFLNHNETSA